MPIRMVSGVSRGMGAIDGGGDHQRGGGSYGENLGHAFVTNGTLLHSFAEVYEMIELSFRVVDGVSGGMHVLDRGPCAPKGRVVWGDLSSHWFQWHLFNTNVFDLCEKS